MTSHSPTIFVDGCSSCGVTAHYVRRVKRVHPDVVVKNSRYDESARDEHVEYLKGAGLPLDRLAPIVVVDTNVTLLDQWKP